MRNYPGDEAKLTLPASKKGAVINLSGNEYIKIEGLEISNLSGNGTYGILMTGGENQVYIQENTVCNFKYGIDIGSLNGNINNVQIENNQIYSNSDGGIRIGGHTKNDETGVAVNCVITKNELTNNGSGDGGFNGEITFEKCYKITVSSNVIRHTSKEYPIFSYALGKEYAARIVIENNKINGAVSDGNILDTTASAYADAKAYLSKKPEVAWKKIVCIGDSITAGYDKENSYPGAMQNALKLIGSDATVYNEGIGGATIGHWDGQSLCDKVKYFEGNADAVFIMAGVCDWFFGENCILGDVDSKDTFIYDFNLLLTLVENKYRNADIFVLIPLEPEYYMGSAALDKDYEDIQNEIRYYAANRDFKVIDLPKDDILNASNASTRQLYYKDSVHPNTQGFKMLGNIILAEALKEINQK